MTSILFLSLDTFSRMGGIQQYNRAFSLALQKNAAARNWRFRHLSLWDDDKPDERYIDPSHFKGFSQRYLAFAWASFQEIRKADVVVLAHVNLLLVAWFMKWFFRKKKTVLVAHGYEVWSSLEGLKAAALPFLKQVWSVSHFTAREVERNQGIPAPKIRLLHNTLDPIFASILDADASRLHERLRIGKKRRFMLTLSRMSRTERLKGYDLVLELLPALLQTVPDICYILAGSYDDHEFFRIQDKIEKLQIKGKVVMPGFIREADLPALYQMCEVFVMPSKKEGFGIVYVEAAWSGCRVIAFDADGSADALLNGALGTLVPASGKVELQKAIEDAFNAPAAEPAKHQFRTLIEQHFGFSTFQQKQAQLIEHLLVT